MKCDEWVVMCVGWCAFWDMMHVVGMMSVVSLICELCLYCGVCVSV